MRIFVFFSFLFSSLSHGTNIDFSDVTEFITLSKNKFELPYGTALIVVKENQVVFEDYQGYSNIQNKQLVNKDSVFYIASLTKSIFSLAILNKINSGDIDENTPLTELFPDIKFKNTGLNKVTIKHLLNHTSSLNEELLIWPTAYTGLHDKKLMLDLISKIDFNEPNRFGTFQYSNVGYNILSQWYDDVYDSWKSSLHEEVYTPIGMLKTSSFISEAKKNDWLVSKPYSVISPNKQPLSLEKTDATMHAAGGTISTANDLANYIKIHLNEGRLNGKQIFPKSVILNAHTKVVDIEPDGRKRALPKTGYAWGWFTGEYKSHSLLHHTGVYYGASSLIAMLPKEKIGVVILNNEGRLGDTLNKMIADGIFRILLGEKDTKKYLVEKLESLYPAVMNAKNTNLNSLKALKTEINNLSLNKTNYCGRYHHRYLGSIIISCDAIKNQEIKISWGSLKSKLYASGTTDSVKTTLFPNKIENIEFQTQEGKVLSMKYKNFVFPKITHLEK